MAHFSTNSRASRLLIGVAAAGLIAGACSHKQPETELAPSPAPIVTDQALTDGGMGVTYKGLMDLSESDDRYVPMALAAAGYVRHIVPGKVIGFFQPDLASPEFREMVDQVTKTYSFPLIRSEDFGVVCKQPSAQQQSGTLAKAATNCSMGRADVVVQFNTVRVARDSGWVGGSTTQAPRNGNRSGQSAFCITLVRQQAKWLAIRSQPVDLGRRCPR
jgi:hypothetical protein